MTLSPVKRAAGLTNEYRHAAIRVPGGVDEFQGDVAKAQRFAIAHRPVHFGALHARLDLILFSERSNDRRITAGVLDGRRITPMRRMPVGNGDTLEWRLADLFPVIDASLALAGAVPARVDEHCALRTDNQIGIRDTSTMLQVGENVVYARGDFHTGLHQAALSLPRVAATNPGTSAARTYT